MAIFNSYVSLPEGTSLHQPTLVTFQASRAAKDESLEVIPGKSWNDGLQNGSFKGTQRFNGIYNMSHDIILYSHGISHIISATILYMVALQILYSHGDRGTYDMRYLNFMRFNGIYNMDDIAFYPRFFNRKNETT